MQQSSRFPWAQLLASTVLLAIASAALICSTFGSESLRSTLGTICTSLAILCAAIAIQEVMEPQLKRLIRKAHFKIRRVSLARL